ncbi:MAG: DNA repair protein RecN [Succinatimonas sp.]|nr:DNA repair protein RecN [Succinatimonas sp.]
MLEELRVRNFVLSRDNVMEFSTGLTAITGETGAGKSLTVDALLQVLGGRTDAQTVRRGSERAEIEAVFTAPENTPIDAFLKERELSSEEHTVVLRRMIGKDGRSRAWINTRAVTLSVLKEAGSLLVSVHGQHASVRLMDERHQLALLDTYGRLEGLSVRLSQAFNAYNTERNRLQSLSDEQKRGAAVFRTLKADFDRLTALDLEAGDYEELSRHYDTLESSQEVSAAAMKAAEALSDDENAPLRLINDCRYELEDLLQDSADDELKNALEIFAEGCEKLENAKEALEALSIPSDPAECERAGEKLARIHELARRFHTEPGDLYKYQQELEQQLDHFLSLKDEITALTSRVRQLRDAYEKIALELSERRADAAERMGQAVSAELTDLAMPDGRFLVSCKRNEECRPRQSGRDDVQFLFTANRGQELMPLDKAASGGELSRLALAIEVLTTEGRNVPVLVFDEVDTGISGRTASAVGQLLKQLGSRAQVLTVTHLPQVAAAASHQYLVVKRETDDGTESLIKELDYSGRIEELSRMMGGNTVTEATREGAKALLEHA